jgi:hypothetical protein
MRLGGALRAHFMQHDGQAAPGDLPGGFGAGEAAADDMDGAGGILFGHAPLFQAECDRNPPFRKNCRLEQSLYAFKTSDDLVRTFPSAIASEVKHSISTPVQLARPSIKSRSPL